MNFSEKTIVLITGANQGIGFEAAKILLNESEKYHILLGSRDPAKGARALTELSSSSSPTKGTISALQIDVTDDDSVDAAAAEVSAQYGRLDILVNNAGIISKAPVVRDNLRAVLATNVVGAVSVTEAFLPLLKKSSSPRIVFVSSSLGSLTHASQVGGPYRRPTGNEYRASKAALNMLMNQYHVRYKEEGFMIFGADPGLVVTNIIDRENQRARGGVEGHVGGERIATVIRGDRDADVGRVCAHYGVVPW